MAMGGRREGRAVPPARRVGPPRVRPPGPPPAAPLLALLLLLLPPGGLAAGAGARPEVTAAEKRVLNVHLVPHTHDDTGWLKTVDQYYYGTNSSIQLASVQYILDTVMPSLEANPERKFTYVETAFFARWWRDQDAAMRARVRALVRSGQLEFANGGWCMHDEAVTYYQDMVDQTTRGHRWLKAELGVVPKVGWQIDPFGHSAVHAYLLSAEAGFEALLFTRIDWRDKEARRANKALEFHWRGSATFGEDTEIFTSVFPFHYNMPAGLHFNYEGRNAQDVVCDDPALEGYNVAEKVDALVEAAEEYHSYMLGDDVMLLMGDDFHYGNANAWFKNLDKLIEHARIDGRVNAFYSTPRRYALAKKAAPVEYPVKTGDFFPYASRAHQYWTGYFTSRPTSKYYIRRAGGYLQAARQLELVNHFGFKGVGVLGQNDALEVAVALAQHHDAITGTEMQHVANDYAQRLSRGLASSSAVVSRAFGNIVRYFGAGVDLAAGQTPPAGAPRRVTGLEALRRLAEAGPGFQEGGGGGAHFARCPELNISRCDVTEAATAAPGGGYVRVALWNPTGWVREEFVRVPVASDRVAVFSGFGDPVVSQLLPLSEATEKLRAASKCGGDARRCSDPGEGSSGAGSPTFTLVFKAELMPMGFANFIVVSGDRFPARAVPAAMSDVRRVGAGEDYLIELANGHVQATFSNAGGALVDLAHGVRAAFDPQMHWYAARQAKPPPNSGAYSFRPVGKAAMPGDGALTVVTGPVVSEVRRAHGEWASLEYRLYEGARHLEAEWTVGPVPVDDGQGKEVVVEFATDLASGERFRTDANGRDLLPRTRNATSDEPVAGNYYPMAAAAALREEEGCDAGAGAAACREFALVTDRGQGASSLRPGQLEVMLHRRLLVENQGVREHLNETQCGCRECDCPGLAARGAFRLAVGRAGGPAAAWRRSAQERVQNPVVAAFHDLSAAGVVELVPDFATMGAALPPNVGLMTLQPLGPCAVLLRLAHLYERGEHPARSRKARVDLRALVPEARILRVEELTLTANAAKGRGEPGAGHRAGHRGRPLASPRDTFVELGPMEIRTFNLTVNFHEGHHSACRGDAAREAAVQVEAVPS